MVTGKTYRSMIVDEAFDTNLVEEVTAILMKIEEADAELESIEDERDKLSSQIQKLEDEMEGLDDDLACQQKYIEDLK